MTVCEAFSRNAVWKMLTHFCLAWHNIIRVSMQTRVNLSCRVKSTCFSALRGSAAWAIHLAVSGSSLCGTLFQDQTSAARAHDNNQPLTYCGTASHPMTSSSTRASAIGWRAARFNLAMVLAVVFVVVSLTIQLGAI